MRGVGANLIARPAPSFCRRPACVPDGTGCRCNADTGNTPTRAAGCTPHLCHRWEGTKHKVKPIVVRNQQDHSRPGRPLPTNKSTKTFAHPARAIHTRRVLVCGRSAPILLAKLLSLLFVSSPAGLAPPARGMLRCLDEGQVDALLDIMMAQLHPGIVEMGAMVLSAGPNSGADEDDAHAQTERCHRRESFSFEAALSGGSTVVAIPAIADGLIARDALFEILAQTSKSLVERATATRRWH